MHIHIAFFFALILGAQSSEPTVSTQMIESGGQQFKLIALDIPREEQQRHMDAAAIKNRGLALRFVPANKRYQLVATHSASSVGDVQPQAIWERRFVVNQTNRLTLYEEDLILNSVTVGDTREFAPRILGVLHDTTNKTSVVSYQQDTAVWADVASLTDVAPKQLLSYQGSRICDQRYLDPPSAAVSVEITKAKAPGTYAIHLKFTSGYSTNYVFDGTKWQPGPAQP